ncbi:MAG: hypothetical protein PHV34_07655 [Verrucomicrobiae bacterium]|nr:hypothetical protein [Verrucomicrobiae bacterium]
MVLKTYPGLIDERLDQRAVLSQQTKGASRLDLIFRIEKRFCIVEIKKVPLTVPHVRQILRYCRAWERTHALTRFHFLIGKQPSDEQALYDVISKSKYDIQLRYLNKHIPTTLVWEGGKYIPHSEGMSLENLVQLRF